MEKYLKPTEIIDSDHPNIKECANNIIKGQLENSSDVAIKLYLFVRDQIRYDPYTHFHKARYYRSSRILSVKSGNCICKAGLLCALSRAVGIPSRLGFADVKNHLATKELIEFMGSETFLYHAYTELFLNKKWVIATPAFNSTLCLRHNVHPLEFDGCNNSIFQAYNLDKKLYMEYVKYHGSFADIPINEILLAWKKGYGEKRVLGWIKEIEKTDLLENRNFYEESLY